MRYLAVLILFCAAIPAAGQAMPQPSFQRLEKAVSEAWARDPTGSVTFGMIKGGRVVGSRSFGAIEGTSRRPADLNTIYRVGSVTKAFTAIMFFQLIDSGTVRLTDPVERYVPEINRIAGRADGAPPITLIQLATHTSGLSAEPAGQGLDVGPVSKWEERLLAALGSTSYQSEPGTRFGYSNIGYAILGLALSRAAKRPYVDYLAERIFRPLGMVDTGFQVGNRNLSRLAAGHVVEKNIVDTAEPAAGHAGRGYKVPAGGIYTTGADLARFVAFLMGNGPVEVLRPERLEAVSRSLITVDRGMGEAYGLGFQLFTNGDVVLQGHGGGLPGYRALQVFDRQSGVGFFLLRSATGGSFGDPVMMIFRAYGVDPPAAPG